MRNLIIFFKIQVEMVCEKVCFWTLALFSVSRKVNKTSRVDDSELNIHIQVLKQTLLSLKCVIKLKKVAIEYAKLKLLKVLSSNKMRYAIVLSFFTTSNPGDMGPLYILR